MSETAEKENGPSFDGVYRSSVLRSFRPFGPWLDMNGKLWFSKDGDWEQAESEQPGP